MIIYITKQTCVLVSWGLSDCFLWLVCLLTGGSKVHWADVCVIIMFANGADLILNMICSWIAKKNRERSGKPVQTSNVIRTFIQSCLVFNNVLKMFAQKHNLYPNFWKILVRRSSKMI